MSDLYRDYFRKTMDGFFKTKGHFVREARLQIEVDGLSRLVAAKEVSISMLQKVIVRQAKRIVELESELARDPAPKPDFLAPFWRSSE